MSNREAIEMMNRCICEIKDLRAVIDRLRPKAEAYDNIATVLHLLPRQSTGAGEDLVWVLNYRIRELTPEAKPAT
jgi:hypothetical protein